MDLDGREKTVVWLALTDCAAYYRKLIAESSNQALIKRLDDAAEAMEILARRFTE